MLLIRYLSSLEANDGMFFLLIPIIPIYQMMEKSILLIAWVGLS